MKPAPPVTIARELMREEIYTPALDGSRRGGRVEQAFDRLDRLVDALEHAHPRAYRRQPAADGGAAEHDRQLWTARAQLEQRRLHPLGGARRGGSEDDEVGALAGDHLEQALGGEVGVEDRVVAG